MQRPTRPSTWRAALAGALIVAATTVAVAAPRVQTGPDAEITEDGLYRVDGATFEYAWARPGLDLSGYDRILLVPPETSFREVRDPGRRRDAHDFPLDDEQKKSLRETIHEGFVEELARSERFTLTDEPGPGVLEIRGAIVDIVSHVPDAPIGRGLVIVKSLGEATLIVELRDSQTQTVLARAVDRRAAKSNFPRRSSSATTQADVRIAVQRWARLLRRRLDEFAVL